MSVYSMTVTLDSGPEDTDRQVREALQAEGFGILSEIDVEAALRDKLGDEIGTYKILGACNPPLAKQAIEADADIGALLPCNIVIRANPSGGTDVVAADPLAMLALGSEALAPIAQDARRRLDAALATLTGNG